MDGTIIRETIKTAPNWFAAVPSLHGGYPVLLLLLLWRERSRKAVIAASTYGAVMWIATIALNQHYVVDLLAGAVVAFIAFRLSERIGSWDSAPSAVSTA
jgi:membrane-associated phospholipid phosphatase